MKTLAPSSTDMSTLRANELWRAKAEALVTTSCATCADLYLDQEGRRRRRADVLEAADRVVPSSSHVLVPTPALLSSGSTIALYGWGLRLDRVAPLAGK